MRNKLIIFFRIVNFLLIILILILLIHKNNNPNINSIQLVLIPKQQIQKSDEIIIMNNKSKDLIKFNIAEKFFYYYKNQNNYENNFYSLLPLDENHLNSFIELFTKQISVYENLKDKQSDITNNNTFIINFVSKGELINSFYFTKIYNSRYINIHLKNSNINYFTEDIFFDFLLDSLNLFSKKNLLINDLENINRVIFNDYQSDSTIIINDKSTIQTIEDLFKSLQSAVTLIELPDNCIKENEICFENHEAKKKIYEIYLSNNTYYWKINQDDYNYAKEISSWTYSRILKTFFN